MLLSPVAPSLSPLIPKRALANLWANLHVNQCHAGASKYKGDRHDSAKGFAAQNHALWAGDDGELGTWGRGTWFGECMKLLRSPVAPSLSPLIPKRALANLWVNLHVNQCYAGASKYKGDKRNSAKGFAAQNHTLWAGDDWGLGCRGRVV
ncbi:hypothetical protein Desmer_3766 [Desulfosporosinus meridiei DSM 13257]|uniref:Uncharacterized protein n=1 Tax=Desulfosporosinus meridiei (strain ATCC BAA-275 / DSM 13257 / KCTC 12902 / NCIMB 13706 / S10) TaxID=768704 RepID=J7IUR4_DESMD|nr:hypothetical protein Desmer_3766 [Desulfosporosinus meridiei DSM 13257]